MDDSRTLYMYLIVLEELLSKISRVRDGRPRQIVILREESSHGASDTGTHLINIVPCRVEDDHSVWFHNTCQRQGTM